MTIQTRYFRTDTATVNGLLARKLLTAISDGSSSESHSKTGNVIAAGATIGIRVWKRTSAPAETEITGGVPVATAFWNTSTYGTMVNGSWNLTSSVSLANTDSIVVRVYGKFGSDAYALFGTYAFSTEQLGGQSLDVATWTVYYYIDLWYESVPNHTWHDFMFDSAPFWLSRITNFTWTPYVAPVRIGGSQGNYAIIVLAGISLWIRRRKKRRFIATVK